MDPALLHTSKNKPVHVHFAGIAGIAMGSVAAALKRNGFTVTGSDTNVYPPMSEVLKQEHIPFNSNFKNAFDILLFGQPRHPRRCLQ